MRNGREPPVHRSGEEAGAQVVVPDPLGLFPQVDGGTPCDVLGVNYYGVAMIDEGGNYANAYPTSAAGWQQIHAEGLFDLLTRLRDDYPNLPPMHITENGIPDDETYPGPHDDARIEYLRTHLEQAARAIGDGVDLRGYYAWSFLDNFEWAEGYSKRFGLVYVDYATQARIPKLSAHWYRDRISEYRGDGLPVSL